jgi:4-coumarate--CoA ligase
MGTFYAGGVFTPANSAYNVNELTCQLKLSKAKVIVSERASLRNAIETANRVGISSANILVVESCSAGFRCWKGLQLVDGTIKLNSNDPDSLALLCFSSGTTGIDVHIYSWSHVSRLCYRTRILSRARRAV